MIFLDAPILPGLSAAGIRLGSSKAEVLELAIPKSIERLGDGAEKLDYGSVTVWTRSGVVDQVGVSGGYSGKLRGCIGLGDSIANIQAAVGPVTEDDEDNLVVLELPGWCFETTEWKAPRTDQVDPSALVTSIFVTPTKAAG